MSDKTAKIKQKWDFIPKNSALLVIDMQNDFVLEGAIMEVPNAKKQVAGIKKLIEACRKKDISVIYTVHETDPEFCKLEIAAFPHLVNAGMRKGTKGAQVIDELKPRASETIIYKHRFSAFYNTKLDLVLSSLKVKKSIDTLIICGTVSNICCESTARDAFYRDYKVIFGSDINSALSEKTHQVVLDNMQIFGKTMTVGEILSVIG